MAVAAGACDVLPGPGRVTLSTVMTEGFGRSAGEYTVSPWPFDESVAFLCQEDPTDGFGADDWDPDPDAECVPLEVTVRDEVLVARLAQERLAPDAVARLDRNAPWYLAAAGRRGFRSFSLVNETQNSPFPSDPGPS